jgi:hypothetical protein
MKLAQKDTKMGENFVSALDEESAKFIVQLYHPCPFFVGQHQHLEIKRLA